MSSSHGIPHTLTGMPFRTKDALKDGFPRFALSSPTLSAPFRGIRSGLRAHDVVAQCEAYALLMPGAHYFSHITAAQLWGLWLPSRFDGSELHVTAPMPRRAPRMAGVVGHKATTLLSEIVLDRGLPLVSPVDAWRQLASMLTIEELTEAGDSLVRRKHPQATQAQLGMAVSRHTGQRGVRTLRVALGQVRAGCDSPRETRLRVVLVTGGLPEPRVNAVVSRPGDPVRFGDLVYEEWLVMVEYDGLHHFSATQRAADIDRLERLRAEGWLIVTVVAAHFKDPGLIVARVEAALRSRGWSR
ncbi:MAG: hypothetical protein H7226_04680 [Salinibacterium sp.]|nr:hypothetical protein [Salinibacterium sp.]